MSNFLYTDKERSVILAGSVARPVPESLETVCYRNALAAYDNKHILDAIANLETVVSHNPCYEDAQERLGYYRQELEGIRANEVLLRRQLHQTPDDAEARFDLADTLYVLDNTEEAVSLWQKLAVQDGGYWGKRAQKMLERADSNSNTAEHTL